MGSWGVGLYSGDFASDLRSTIGAVARLPFDPERLVEILCESESGAANDPQHEEYTTFWLVVADQFARRGIVSPRARDTALQIIEAGVDLEMERARGRPATGLAQRSRMLEQVRQRIMTPQTAAKPRRVLRQAEPFVMDVGDAIVYPVCGRKSLNPYIARREKQVAYGPQGRTPWTQDAWGASVMVERGRAFGFFAWYRPLVVRRPLATKPDLHALADEPWQLQLPGNCPASQFRRMGLERIGAFAIDVRAVHAVFPGLRSGDRLAIADVSIGNRLNIVDPAREAPHRAPYDRIVRIDALAGR